MNNDLGFLRVIRCRSPDRMLTIEPASFSLDREAYGLEMGVGTTQGTPTHSKNTSGEGREMNATVDSTSQQRQAMNLEGFVLCGMGVLKAWAILLVGSAIGYGLAAVIAWRSEWPLVQLSWVRLGSSGLPSVVVPFGMGGFVIESLRFQGQPRPGRYFRAWTSAERLRCQLFLLLCAAAIGVGVFAGLGWSDT
jgi:hypothetical protein